jgi:hypothetical protein
LWHRCITDSGQIWRHIRRTFRNLDELIKEPILLIIAEYRASCYFQQQVSTNDPTFDIAWRILD